MTREETKIFATGKRYLENPQADPREIQAFTEGAIMLYDMLEKKKRDAQSKDVKETDKVGFFT